MDQLSARTGAAQNLAGWASGRGPWSLGDSLRLVRQVACQVQALHASGQVHRGIGLTAIAIDERLDPVLSPPEAACARREAADPEFLPPELAGESNEPESEPPLELPCDMAGARAALARRDPNFDPRRIDVYQLGVLLFRLLTGEPILAYLYDPRIKSQVPCVAQPILDHALGYDTAQRFSTCEPLVAAIDEALRQVATAGLGGRDTPPGGSQVVCADTPPTGHAQAQPPAPAPQAKLPFGELGPYKILARVGSGGMGDVYRGYDASLDRQVAIKVLPAELGRNEEFVRRLHAEATAAAKVAHPNVVPIYTIGEDGGFHYFAMQFIEGQSLADRLRRGRRLPVEEALAVVEQCLQGLAVAHEHGLIHRDIKPGNVLLEARTSRAVLVDFGLVRRAYQSEQLTATGVIMGTVDYIAPEQARGRDLDGRADIYSLGVLFYQALAGRLPFVADTPTAMVFQHAYEPPYPLEKAVPELPEAVRRIVARMMAKDPADRYADCAAVLADIRAFRAGEPLPSDRSSSWDAADTATAALPAVHAPATDESPPPDLQLPPEMARWTSERPLDRLRDWAATMFRRHAPEFVQELQSTTQQVDGAVAHYERRVKEIAGLAAEAQSISAGLAAEIEQEQSDERRAELRKKQDDHGRQSDDLQHQLAKAEARLAQLRSQRDLLNARLRAAEAHQAMMTDRPPSRRLSLWLRLAAAGLVAAVAIAIVMLLPRSRPTPLPPKTPPLSSAAIPTISGVVFQDANANGTFDPGEKPIPSSITPASSHFPTSRLNTPSRALAARTVLLTRLSDVVLPARTFRDSTPGPDERFAAAQFAALGNTLIVLNPAKRKDGKYFGAVYAFDVSTGKSLATLVNPYPQSGDYAFSLAVLDDNSTVAIGQPSGRVRFSQAGAVPGNVYLLHVTTGQPLRVIESPVPQRGKHFGESLAAAEGKILVGAPSHREKGDMIGAAYLFDAASGQLLRTFLPPDRTPFRCFGQSVALAGGRALISVWPDGGRTGEGAYHVFDLSTGNLLQTIRSPAPKPEDRFGSRITVAAGEIYISAAGAGGPEDSGAVYVFDLPTLKLVHTFASPTPRPRQGFGVRTSVSDTLVAIAAQRDGNGQGAVYVFNRKDRKLSHVLLAPRPEDVYFGDALLAVEDRVIVGAPNETAGGAAYLFDLGSGPAPRAQPLEMIAATDSRGHYQFAAVPPGVYWLHAARLSAGEKLSAGSQGYMLAIHSDKQEAKTFSFGWSPAPQYKAATLRIVAEIDGNDSMCLDANGAQWIHTKWKWPKSIELNGVKWEPERSPLLRNAGATAFLDSPIDFTSAKLANKQGRGTVSLDRKDKAMIIRFTDNGAGADKYDLTISFGK